jgi:hypothetical protein
MSDQGRGGPARYTGGQVVVIVLGAILLLPGACALIYIVGSLGEMVSKGQSFDPGNPYLPILLVVWVISFAITTGGILLIRAARRRARLRAD